jgi:thymidylate synthase|tara:strand:- start:274 stop:1152 length:879 start_codon:yes stop_codon:yes gene_type:complete
MRTYLKALVDVMSSGEEKTDRTGTGTKSIFGYQMRFDLTKGFPAVTTKRLAWKSVVGELLWFLEGSMDERRLAEITYGKDRSELKDKRTIWTDNAENQGKELGYSDGMLGPVYGFQWRNFGGEIYNSAPHLKGTDQIEWLINEIKTNPDSRRLILSAWNPNQIDKMALPPCHTLAQFYVSNGKLSCQMYQRSADLFLGVPFNIASYALLTHIIAKITDLEVQDFVLTVGDAHIYNTHYDAVNEQLQRTPQELPTLNIVKDFSSLEEALDLVVSDFQLDNYNPLSAIKAEMAI